MTNTIAWHVKCLEHSRATVERLKQDCERIDNMIKSLQGQNIFYNYQISEALKAHKTEFDRERWRVTKLKKKGGE